MNLLLLLAACAGDPDRATLDSEVWFALGPIGWARVAIVAIGLVLGVGAALLFAIACFQAALSRGELLRHRLVSASLGAGALATVWFCGGGMAGMVRDRLLGRGDDFAALRLEGDVLWLVPAVGEERGRPVRELAGVEVSCGVEEISGEESYACDRSVALLWTDGSRSRCADEVEWGLSPCDGALDAHVAFLRRALAAAGRPGALTVGGDCPPPR